MFVYIYIYVYVYVCVCEQQVEMFSAIDKELYIMNYCSPIIGALYSSLRYSQWELLSVLGEAYQAWLPNNWDCPWPHQTTPLPGSTSSDTDIHFIVFTAVATLDYSPPLSLSLSLSLSQPRPFSKANIIIVQRLLSFFLANVRCLSNGTLDTRTLYIECMSIVRHTIDI